MKNCVVATVGDYETAKRVFSLLVGNGFNSKLGKTGIKHKVNDNDKYTVSVKLSKAAEAIKFLNEKKSEGF